MNPRVAILQLPPLPFGDTHVENLGVLQTSGTFTITDARILSTHKAHIQELGNSGLLLMIRIVSVSDGSFMAGWTVTAPISGSRSFIWIVVP